MEDIKLMPDPLDLREITFTNVLLLGFSVEAKGFEHGITFNRDMFVTPNIKGMEVILHYLFTRINQDLAKEMFRCCWPVKERKQAQEFRKISIDWLNKIKKEDPNCFIPNISPAILLSPSGNRFYQFLFYFSLHVLKQRVTSKPKKFGLIPTRPVITPATKNYTHHSARAIDLSVVIKEKRLIDFVEETVHVKSTWVEYTSQLSKQHRKLSKRKREWEKTVAELKEKMQMKFGKSSTTSKDILKRAQDLLKVTENWKSISKFFETQQKVIEQVQNIINNNDGENLLDGGNINFKIPDILVRECERQLHMGNKYDNIYEDGKVDLTSLVNMWNLSLHLVKEGLTEFPLPNVSQDEAYIRAEAHKHGNCLNNAISVKHSLQNQISDLNLSIEVLQEQLQKYSTPTNESAAKLPEKFRLEILPSTPSLVFEPISDVGQFEFKANVSGGKTVATPDAVKLILDKLDSSVQKEGTPINPTISKLISESKKQSNVKESKSTKPPVSSKIPTWKRKQEQKENIRPVSSEESNMAAAQRILIEQITESVVSNNPNKVLEKVNKEILNLHAFEKPFEAFNESIFVHQDKVKRTPQKMGLEKDVLKSITPSTITPLGKDFFTPIRNFDSEENSMKLSDHHLIDDQADDITDHSFLAAFQDVQGNVNKTNQSIFSLFHGEGCYRDNVDSFLTPICDEKGIKDKEVHSTFAKSHGKSGKKNVTDQSILSPFHDGLEDKCEKDKTTSNLFHVEQTAQSKIDRPILTLLHEEQGEKSKKEYSIFAPSLDEHGDCSKTEFSLITPFRDEQGGKNKTDSTLFTASLCSKGNKNERDHLFTPFHGKVDTGCEMGDAELIMFTPINQRSSVVGKASSDTNAISCENTVISPLNLSVEQVDEFIEMIKEKTSSGLPLAEEVDISSSLFCETPGFSNDYHLLTPDRAEKKTLRDKARIAHNRGGDVN